MYVYMHIYKCIYIHVYIYIYVYISNGKKTGGLPVAYDVYRTKFWCVRTILSIDSEPIYWI